MRLAAMPEPPRRYAALSRENSAEVYNALSKPVNLAPQPTPFGELVLSATPMKALTPPLAGRIRLLAATTLLLPLAPVAGWAQAWRQTLNLPGRRTHDGSRGSRWRRRRRNVPGRTDLFNTSHAYYGEATNDLGAFVYYRLNKWGKKMKIQLNADGITNDEHLHPYSAVDAGNGTPIMDRYSVGKGRNFALTTTFDF